MSHPLAERLVAWLRPAGRSSRSPALFDSGRYHRARALVAAFYAVLAFLAVGTLYAWEGYLAARELDPRWAVGWLRWVEPGAGIGAILWLHLLGALAGVLWHRHRWARVLVFVSLLEFLSLRFSFGSINHGEHLGLLLACVLIFLPRGWDGDGIARPPDRRGRVATLLVFSGCQALLLLTYSMSGLWKAIGLARQTIAGEVSYLWPRGLAQQVASKLLGAEATTPLGPWLIEHAWVGWPLGLGAIYLELFALWVVFRPRLHRAWGAALLLFHVATHLTMGIGFVQHVLWLALFLLFSPLQEAASWRQVARQLPGAGWLRGRDRQAATTGV